MFTGANALKEPFNHYIINVRASYYQETGAAVKHLVEDLGRVYVKTALASVTPGDSGALYW